MIELFIASLIVYGLLSSVAYVNAKRKNSLYWTDIFLPIVVVLFWIALTMLGYGHQSLSHVIEVPIALFVVAVLFNAKVFFLDNRSKESKRNSLIVFGIGLLIVIALRTFMPYLPE